jgi:hypothetical protein
MAEAAPGKRLYVGGLAKAITTEELARKYASQFPV